MTWVAPLFLLLLLLDMQNVLAPFRRVLKLPYRASSDYTILIPIYGDPSYFQNAGYLRRYRANVLIVVNVHTEEMEAFAHGLETERWRVFRTHFAHKPCPPEMLRPALAAVDTGYVIRMDGDTWSDQDPGRAIAAAEYAHADLCSAKISPSRRETLIECLQGVEYDMAMLGRHNRAWMTSGACIVGRTAAFARILDNHSLWFPGEDIETGLVANHLRMRVRHVDFRVYTVVPRSLAGWFRQRRVWWSGHFRQSVVNCDKNLRYPTWVLYNTCLIWALLAAKQETLLKALQLLPLLVLVYTGVTAVANWPVRSRWMIAYPYYALAQALVMPIFGAAYYVEQAWLNRRLGRFRIGYLRPRLQT